MTSVPQRFHLQSNYMFIVTARVGKKREIHNLDGVTVEITMIKISGDEVQFGIGWVDRPHESNNYSRTRRKDDEQRMQRRFFRGRWFSILQMPMGRHCVTGSETWRVMSALQPRD